MMTLDEVEAKMCGLAIQIAELDNIIRDNTASDDEIINAERVSDDYDWSDVAISCFFIIAALGVLALIIGAATLVWKVVFSV